jgi:flagellar L-ring protein precursor FlgH
LGGINLNSASISTGGSGAANQKASLQGAVTVTVVELLGNGNLVVRGEKQLSLTEGSEIVQVSGIVRPEDISPNNIVQSRRLANANISYRGTGDMAKATTPGWGTSLLLKIWPF